MSGICWKRESPEVTGRGEGGEGRRDEDRLLFALCYSLFAVCFLLSLMGCGKAQTMKDAAVPSLQQPSQKILSLNLHSLERGDSRWILTAKRAEVYEIETASSHKEKKEKKNIISGKEIRITFYEKNQPASRLSAPEGSMGLEKQEMGLEGVPMAVLFQSLKRNSIVSLISFFFESW